MALTLGLHGCSLDREGSLGGANREGELSGSQDREEEEEQEEQERS